MSRVFTRALVVGMLAAVSLGSAARAQVWNEVGDAGRNGVGAAQSTVGNGALTTINGSFDVPADVDLYRIRITNEAAFRAEITAYAGPDPALYLFNADGTLQVHNDDTAFASFLSTITSQGVFSNGVYYIGISNHPNIPVTAANIGMATFTEWPGPDFQQRQSSGGVLAGWNDAVGAPSDPFAAYSISLQGAEFDVVPAPGAAAVLVLGGLGLARRRRADV